MAINNVVRLEYYHWFNRLGSKDHICAYSNGELIDIFFSFVDDVVTSDSAGAIIGCCFRELVTPRYLSFSDKPPAISLLFFPVYDSVEYALSKGIFFRLGEPIFTCETGDRNVPQTIKSYMFFRKFPKKLEKLV